MSEDFAKHLVIIWNQRLRVSSWIAPWAEAGWLAGCCSVDDAWLLDSFPHTRHLFTYPPNRCLFLIRSFVGFSKWWPIYFTAHLWETLRGENVLLWFVLCCNWAALPIWWKLNISLSEASRSCEESTAAFGDTGVGVCLEERRLWINIPALASN